jgi:hypothetical protein
MSDIWLGLRLLDSSRRLSGVSQSADASSVSGGCSSTDYILPQNATSPAVGTTPTKKDPNAPIPTPLERMLLKAGPVRNDGSDKFFGMENVCVSLNASVLVLC